MSSAGTFVRQLRIEQRVFWRNRQGVFFTFVFPLMLLLFFASVSDGSTGGVDATAFIVTGIAALAIVSTTFQALAIAVSIHRETGVLKRLLATPLKPSTLLAAKVGSVALVAVLEVVIIVAAARVGYGIALPADWPLFVVSCLVGGAAFSALGFALAAAIRSADVAPAVTNIVYLPMMFVSGVFYDLAQMPGWLQHVGQAMPLYHLVEPLRASYLGVGPASGSLAVHLAVLSAWGLAGSMYVAFRFRWEPDWEA